MLFFNILFYKCHSKYKPNCSAMEQIDNEAQFLHSLDIRLASYPPIYSDLQQITRNVNSIWPGNECKHAY